MKPRIIIRFPGGDDIVRGVLERKSHERLSKSTTFTILSLGGAEMYISIPDDDLSYHNEDASEFELHKYNVGIFVS